MDPSFKPVEMRACFIVNSSLKEQFCLFIHEKAKTWMLKDWDGLKRELEQHYCLLLEDSDPLVKRIISKLEDPAMFGKIFYCIKCPEIRSSICYFDYFLYSTSDDWEDFYKTYKRIYNVNFLEHEDKCD